MRILGTLLLMLFTVGCGGVKHLSLSDDRLPIEARRWLADAGPHLERAGLDPRELVRQR